MLHVPLIIFFNDSAFNIYKEKFDKLKKLESKNLTLKVLSDIILYLNDIDVLNKKEVLYKADKFKSLESKFIYDRIDLDGILSKVPVYWEFEGSLKGDAYLEKNFLNKIPVLLFGN